MKGSMQESEKKLQTDFLKLKGELQGQASRIMENTLSIGNLESNVKADEETIASLLERVHRVELDKHDASHFEKTYHENFKALTDIHSDLDAKEAKIRTIERFVDKFIPVRI